MELIAAKRLSEQETGPRPAAPAAATAAIPAVTRNVLSIKVHRSMEEVQLLWRSMEADQCCPVHQTYDWCRSWVAAKSPELAIAVGHVDGEPAFILPLEVVNRPGMRVARYIASRFSNMNNGIFAEAGRSFFAEPQSAAAFVAEMRQHSPGPDCVVLDKLPFEWRGLRNPLSRMPHVRNQNEAFQITLDCGFEELLQRANGKRKRKRFRASSRRLDAAGGWEHLVAGTPEEALALLELFFAQKGERLKAQGLPDVFAAEDTRAFFRNLAQQAPRGDRQLLQLHAIRLGGAEGQLCAIAGISRKGDHLTCQLASIDSSICPEASPGELLFHLMIGQACAEGAAMFDFGIGDHRYKRSWCDVETRHYDVVLPLTARGHAYAAGYRAKVAAIRFVKHNAVALRLASRIRALALNVKPAED